MGSMTEMDRLVRDEVGPEAQDFIHNGSESMHRQSVCLGREAFQSRRSSVNGRQGLRISVSSRWIEWGVEHHP